MARKRSSGSLKLLRTIGFHLCNFWFGILLIIVNSLSLGGAVFFLLPIATCSTRLLRRLVAKLWRMELQLHGFLTRRKDYSQWNRRHRQMEVTGPAMTVSLLYFVWFRAFFNLIFSSVPLAIWALALTAFFQVEQPVTGFEVNGSTLWGILFAALAYWIGKSSAWASLFLSERVLDTMFGKIDERAYDEDGEQGDDVHTALLLNHQSRQQPSYGYGASALPPPTERLHPEQSDERKRSIMLHQDSCGRSMSPHPPLPPPPTHPPLPPPLAPLPPPPPFPPQLGRRESSQQSNNSAAPSAGRGSYPDSRIRESDDSRTRRFEDHLPPDIVEVKCCGFKAVVKKHRHRRFDDRSPVATPVRDSSQQDYDAPLMGYQEAHVYATPVPAAELSHHVARALDSKEQMKGDVPVASPMWDMDSRHRRYRSASDDEQQLASRMREPKDVFGRRIDTLHRSISEALDLATQIQPEAWGRHCHHHHWKHHQQFDRGDFSRRFCMDKQGFRQLVKDMKKFKSQFKKEDFRQLRDDMKQFKKQFKKQKKEERARPQFAPSAPDGSLADFEPAVLTTQKHEPLATRIKRPAAQMQYDVPTIKPLALSTRQPPVSPTLHKSRSDETDARRSSKVAAARSAGARAPASRIVKGGDEEKQILTCSTDSVVQPDEGGKRLMQQSNKYQSAASHPPVARERWNSWDENMTLEFQGRYSTAFGQDAKAAEYDKAFDLTFAESPETIQALEMSPVYRGASENLLETGLPASYTTFSPLASPNAPRLSLEGPQQYDEFQYDVLSPVARDGNEEFPSELPDVYRSIGYNGPISNGSDSEWNRSLLEQQAKRDKVHFNAFAPPWMFPSPKSFLFTVWAFLLNQKSEMKEQAKALDPDALQLSVDTKLEFRRGAFVHVILEVPHGFHILNGATQRFEWQGKITKVPYEIECTDDAPLGQVLFKARIVVGSEVAVLRSYVFVSKQRPQDRGVDAEMLESTLDVMPVAFREIPYESLQLKQLVGKGYFGDAYQATLDGEEVVVKTIRASELGETSDQIVKEFQHEAALLSMFGHHPNIVPFRGACTDFSHPLCLVTKYLPYGSLEDQFHKPKADQTLSMVQRQAMLRDAAAGILNIHEGGFVHRDIAARNCLVDNDYRVKICDFGLCRRVDMSYGGSLVQDGIGPLKYMAPESLQPPHAFSYHSDSYMFGVLMWEMMTMSAPFASMSPFQAAVRVLEGDRLPIPQQIPDPLKHLMASCFHEDPSRRPSMAKILLSLDAVPGFSVNW